MEAVVEDVGLYPSVLLLLFPKACADSFTCNRGCHGTPGLNSGISSTKLNLAGKEEEEEEEEEAGTDSGGSEELVWGIPLEGSDATTVVEEVEAALKPDRTAEEEMSSRPLLPSLSFSTGPEMICCRREMLWAELWLMEDREGPRDIFCMLKEMSAPLLLLLLWSW